MNYFALAMYQVIFQVATARQRVIRRDSYHRKVVSSSHAASPLFGV